MRKRKDWLLFQELLDHFGIRKLYHFTDRSNIASIIKNGGLYSWGECENKGIHISCPGGSELSHELDKRDNLQNYVRLSFCKHHPMMYYAMKESRIKDPVILEIDTDVLFIKGNIFSDRNAVKNEANKGNTFEDFKKIHFQTTLQRNVFDINEGEQEYYQAEVLVSHYIPLQYILNIEKFKEESSSTFTPNHNSCLDNQQDDDRLLIFITSQSSYTKAEKKIGKVNKTRASVFTDALNLAVQNIITKCSNCKKSLKSISIGAIGYGDYAYSLYNGKLKYRSSTTLNELNENIFQIENIEKQIRTRQGIKAITTSVPKWFIEQSKGNANLLSALNKAYRIVVQWIANYPNAEPPIIIHMSDSGYTNEKHDKVIMSSNILQSTFTSKGNSIFVNLFLLPEESETILFPSSTRDLKEGVFYETYYLMSSYLSRSLLRKLNEGENNTAVIEKKACIFTSDVFEFNAYLNSVVSLLV